MICRLGLVQKIMLSFMIMFFAATGFAMKSANIKVDGYNIHYEDSVNGNDVILFVHGLPLNASSWQAQLNFFKKRSRVIAIDLPGYGQSSPLPSPLPNEMSAWYGKMISHFLTKLNIQKVTYVGFASAGHVGMKFAVDHHDQLNRLVLINASPQFMRSEDWPYGFTEEQSKKITSDISSSDYKEALNHLVVVATQEKNIADMASIRESMINMGMMSNKKTLLAFFEKTAYENYRPLLSQITVPTLLITSSMDKEVPPGVGVYMRQHIPLSQHVEVSDADHFVFATAPEYFNQILNRFIYSS